MIYYNMYLVKKKILKYSLKTLIFTYSFMQNSFNWEINIV